MGQRGPGAKPVRKPTRGAAKTGPAKRRKRPAWKRTGLTRGQRVISFVQSLKLTSGPKAGKPFRLDGWQKRIIREVYDASTEDGRRLARIALLTCGRKNGKTGLVAALVLCHLVGPESESRGQIVSAASDKNQAAIIFREAKAMALADDDLKDRIIVRDFAKEMEDVETGSTYVALSSDVETKHGLNPSLIIFDELGQAADRRLFDVLETSMGARSSPLMWIISTQSADHASPMSEMVDYAKDVAAGVIEDPAFRGFVYEVPEDADVFDEANWPLANPGLGTIRSIEELRSYAAKAKRLPSRLPAFRNLYMNQRSETTAGLISGPDWKACTGNTDLEALAGQRCFGGLDLSSTRDLTSLVLYFPDSGAVLVWAWVPGDTLKEREKAERGIPYRLWRDQGLIEAPAGRAIDKKFVAARAVQIAERYDLVALAFDRWRIEDFTVLLDAEGITLPLRPWGQGYKDMSPAIDAFEDLVLEAKLQHGGNPVLTSHVAAAVVDVDPTEARKLNKRKARSRIDCLQALCMAIGIAAREPEPVKYDFSRDLVLKA
jgi:phage terminase large subunit-like protein